MHFVGSSSWISTGYLVDSPIKCSIIHLWFSYRFFSSAFSLGCEGTWAQVWIAWFLQTFCSGFSKYTCQNSLKANLWDLKTKKKKKKKKTPFCSQSCIGLLFSWDLRPKWHSPGVCMRVIWMRTKKLRLVGRLWHPQPFIFKIVSKPAGTVLDPVLN